ncbi:MAG TPA: CHAP domain-containing protein [Anaeromyxobacteraceae bacterium]|nr:CHAP domain-containing protein [Anaeromyxobacteraceae bacterium]
MRLAPLALALAACAAAPAVPERSGAAPGRWVGASPAAAPHTSPGPPTAISAPGTPRIPAAPADSRPPARERLVAAARRHLGRPWPGDCSDFVERVHAEAGVPLAPHQARSASEGLWRASRPVQRPRPGDLAFFHDTFDRDRDGRRGDRYTHVALVEAVDGPRVMLIHRGSRGIQRLPMNLARRHDPAENGWLRKRRAGDPPGRFLSGELFTAWATAVPAETVRLGSGGAAAAAPR